MKEIIRYFADDGMEFDNELEYEKYEILCMFDSIKEDYIPVVYDENGQRLILKQLFRDGDINDITFVNIKNKKAFAICKAIEDYNGYCFPNDVGLWWHSDDSWTDWINIENPTAMKKFLDMEV